MPIDQEEVFKLRTKEVALNSSDSLDILKLARMYAKGEGTAVNEEKAAELMRLAVTRASHAVSVQTARDWLNARGLAL